MVIFYKKWKKYNEIQLTKNKMDLNIRKMTNHPPSLTPIKKKNWCDVAERNSGSWLLTFLKPSLFVFFN